MVTLKKIWKKASEFRKHLGDARFSAPEHSESYYVVLPSRTKVRTYLNLIVRLNQTSREERAIIVRFGFRKWIILSKWFSKIPNLYFSHPLKRVPPSILVSHQKNADIRIDFNYPRVFSTSNYVEDVIPYIMHPSNYLRREEFQIHEEKFGGIVSAGNFSEKIYNTDVLHTTYGLNNRWQIYNELCSLKETVQVNGRNYMAEFKDKSYIDKLVLIQWHTGGIPNKLWLEHLSTFRYIFCAPGMTMPLCHNILEAMRVGVVPITNYANWLNPSLEDGVNCFVYNKIEDIASVVKNALELSKQDYLVLRSNAIDYFNTYYKDYDIEQGTYTILNEDTRDL